MSASLPPIPWEHELSDLQSIWLWETEEFTVRVLGDVHRCYFTVTDTWQDPSNPRILTDGQTASFRQAENRVREIIGKVYPVELGYRKYAGSLATTFMIASGQRFDFGTYEDEIVTIEVFTGPETISAMTGRLKIDHYYLALIKGQTHISVRPTHVKSIELVHRAPQMGEKSRKYEKISGRTFRAGWKKGCTGISGFLPNTVDHREAVCPIHER